MSRRLPLTLIASVVQLAIPLATATAQLGVTLDAATGRVSYDDVPRSTVVTISPTLLYERPRSTLAATGTLSRFAGDVWSAQGLVAGSAFTPPISILRGEASAQAAFNSHREITRTAQLFAQARVHVLSESRGAWIGGGAGRSWTTGDGLGMVRTDAGAWARVRSATLRLTITRTSFRDSASGFDFSPRAEAVLYVASAESFRHFTHAYTDAECTLRWSLGAVEMDGSLGRRFDDRALSHTTWSMGGTLRLSDNLAVAGGLGRYAADLSQGLPGGRYGTVGLRFTAGSWPAASTGDRTLAPAIEHFEIGDNGDGTSTFRILAPSARRIELMGDFTDWQPVSLRRAPNGGWEITLPLARGTHRVNVRLDEGSWVVPPGITPVRDDFNGVVGVVVVTG